MKKLVLLPEELDYIKSMSLDGNVDPMVFLSLSVSDFEAIRAYINDPMTATTFKEAARAMLIGDGRLSTDDDKISPEHIRPIWGDDPLYSIPVHVEAGEDTAATAKAIIKKVIKARKDYKGSGNLTMFTTEDWLSEMLLLEDGIGHPLYPDSAALARKLRVNRIVTVPVMENQYDDDGNELMAIIVSK